MILIQIKPCYLRGYANGKTEAHRSDGAQAAESGRYPEGAGLRVEAESVGVERKKAEWGCESGLMEVVGVVSPRTKGTPQGGPLSPLLSNILLTELDRELERRGLALCRDADDCNIEVRSQAAGERVLGGSTQFRSGRLELAVNEAKSAVARPWERTFLGDSVSWHTAPKLRIAPDSDTRLEGKIREVLKGARGRSLSGRADAGAGIPLGLQSRRPWCKPHAAFRKSCFDRLGLVSLFDTMRRLQCLG